MAYETDRPIEGEPHTPKDPASSSGLAPLPYHPNLKRELQSVTGALLLAYLEIHHPAPRDPNGAILNTPVTLDLDAVAADLGVSRRTLCISLSILSAWWPTEEARGRAARSGLEFFNLSHHATPDGIVTPQRARGLGDEAQSSDYAATLHNLTISCKSSELTLLVSHFKRPNIYYPGGPITPFQRQLHTSWHKKNTFEIHGQ